MGIESSASLLSTQIVNIVHEKNPDVRDAEIEKMNKIRGPDKAAGKDEASSFKEAEVSAGTHEGTKAAETYNENGYLNSTSQSSDLKDQEEHTVDMLV